LVLSFPGRLSTLQPVPGVVTQPSGSPLVAVPGALAVEVMGKQGKLVPLATAGPTGYTPQQLQTAYGLN
jgi:hypothetical protein